MAKNQVLAGDYVNSAVIYRGSKIWIAYKVFSKIEINKSTVESYQLADSDEKISASSAVTRGAVGSLLLGPIGIAAALSAKKNKLYVFEIDFKDGKRSLVQVDKTGYLILQKNLF